MNNENPNQLTPDPSNPSQGPEPQNQRQDIELQHKIIEPPLPPTLPPKKSKKKLWIMLILLLLIIGVGAGSAYAYLTTTADSKKATSNDSTTKTTDSKATVPEPEITLETYESKDIGLAFDYPATWNVTDDSSNFTSENRSPNDDTQVVESPSGFKMYFNTLSADGFGGTGPCPKITNYASYGEAKLSKYYAQSYTLNGFSLYLSKNETLQQQMTNCFYDNLINVKEAATPIGDSSFSPSPFSLTFGTFPGYGSARKQAEITKPSDTELREAVDILLSLRKI